MALPEGRFECEGKPVVARPVPKVPPEVWMLGTNSKCADFAAELGAGYVFGQFMSDADALEVLSAIARSSYLPRKAGATGRSLPSVSSAPSRLKRREA